MDWIDRRCGGTKSTQVVCVYCWRRALEGSSAAAPRAGSRWRTLPRNGLGRGDKWQSVWLPTMAVVADHARATAITPGQIIEAATGCALGAAVPEVCRVTRGAINISTGGAMRTGATNTVRGVARTCVPTVGAIHLKARRLVSAIGLLKWRRSDGFGQNWQWQLIVPWRLTEISIHIPLARYRATGKVLTFLPVGSLPYTVEYRP
jgi:hypothetical protein